MNKYKTGDIVKGNNFASIYGITRSGRKCIVVTDENSEGIMSVKVLDPTSERGEVDAHPVDAHRFELVNGAEAKPSKPKAKVRQKAVAFANRRLFRRIKIDRAEVRQLIAEAYRAGHRSGRRAKQG